MSQTYVRNFVGLEEPEADAELLPPTVSTPPPEDNRADDTSGGGDSTDSVAAAQRTPAPPSDASDASDEATLEIINSGGWMPAIADLEKAIAHAGSFDKARKIIARYIDKIGLDKLAEIVARARLAARLAAAAGETLDYRHGRGDQSAAAF